MPKNAKGKGQGDAVAQLFSTAFTKPTPSREPVTASSRSLMVSRPCTSFDGHAQTWWC